MTPRGKVRIRIPADPEAWLHEIAAAYLDAREAMAFGDLLGEPFGEADLFHLAPLVSLKFRGLPHSAALERRVSSATLASYVANERRHPGTLGDPLLAFAFCYLASHFSLGILSADGAEEVMGHVQSHRQILAGLAGRRPRRPARGSGDERQRRARKRGPRGVRPEGGP
jgi:hypothetical protein